MLLGPDLVSQARLLVAPRNLGRAMIARMRTGSRHLERRMMGFFASRRRDARCCQIPYLPRHLRHPGYLLRRSGQVKVLDISGSSSVSTFCRESIMQCQSLLNAIQPKRNVIDDYT